jgi:hypothetical protein
LKRGQSWWYSFYAVFFARYRFPELSSRWWRYWRSSLCELTAKLLRPGTTNFRCRAVNGPGSAFNYCLHSDRACEDGWCEPPTHKKPHALAGRTINISSVRTENEKKFLHFLIHDRLSINICL